MNLARAAGLCAAAIVAIGCGGFAIALAHAQPATVLTIVPPGNGFQISGESSNDGADVVLLESIPASTSEGATLNRWDWDPANKSITVEASMQEIVHPERCDLLVVINSAQAASSPGALEPGDSGWSCRAMFTDPLLDQEGAQIGVQFVAGASIITTPLVSLPEQ